MVEHVAARRRDRTVHAVADTSYICTELRRLPAGVTLTGPLPHHAAPREVRPDADNPPIRQRGPGRPRVRGDRIGTPAELTATTQGCR